MTKGTKTGHIPSEIQTATPSTLTGKYQSCQEHCRRPRNGSLGILLVTFRWLSARGRQGTPHMSRDTATHFSLLASRAHLVEAVMMQKLIYAKPLKKLVHSALEKCKSDAELLFFLIPDSRTCLPVRRSQYTACRSQYDVGGIRSRRCFMGTCRMELATGCYVVGPGEA